MKILILIDWFLPGTKSGGPVRSIANLIDHLGDEFEFLVITRDTDYCEADSYPNIKIDEWNTLRKNLHVFYISQQGLSKNFLNDLITSTSFDIAYINGIYSRFFSILPVYLLKSSEKQVIIAARGMLNPQAFSVKPFKKKLFLKLMNLTKFYKKVTFHATNEDEATFIRKAVKVYKEIKVAPNLHRKIQTVKFKKIAKNDIVRFVSVARVAKEKGTLTALQALAQVENDSEIIYEIFGPIYDHEYWKKCQEVINKLPHNIKVNYKGSIAGNNVPALLQNYHFFMMPSEGENFGHGILEALTAGRPVLISNRTPWKNLESKEIGWDCALNTTDLNMALNAAITMEKETYSRWSAKSYDFALEYCNESAPVDANKNLFLK